MNKTTLINKLTQGNQEFDILGWVCWWNIRNVDIQRDNLITRLSACNLEVEVKPHNYVSAFKRALKQLEEKRIISTVEDTPSRVVVQFTIEQTVQVDDGKQLKYDYETQIVVDKVKFNYCKDFGRSIVRDNALKYDENNEPVKDENNNLVRIPDSEHIKKLKDRLVALYENEREMFNSNDITRLIQVILDRQADIVSLRQQGSVYFVPSAYTNLINSISSFVNNLTASSSFEHIPLINYKSNRELIGRAFNDDADSILSTLDDEISNVSDGEKTQKWLETKLAFIKKLSARVEMYTEVLESKTKDEFTRRMETLEKRIRSVRVLDL